MKTAIPVVHALEHHVLEVLAFQWDGSRANAKQIASDLKHELPSRDATIHSIHHRQTSSTNDFHADELTVHIERRSDGHEWNIILNHDQWLAFWLHQERVYMVTSMNEAEGALFFRRTNPVVRLDNRRQVTD
jgi:hypothetical protein